MCTHIHYHKCHVVRFLCTWLHRLDPRHASSNICICAWLVCRPDLPRAAHASASPGAPSAAPLQLPSLPPLRPRREVAWYAAAVASAVACLLAPLVRSLRVAVLRVAVLQAAVLQAVLQAMLLRVARLLRMAMLLRVVLLRVPLDPFEHSARAASPHPAPPWRPHRAHADCAATWNGGCASRRAALERC